MSGPGSAANITAPALLALGPANVVNLSCQAAGTIVLNDAASVATAGTANQIYIGTLVTGQAIAISLQVARGLVASAVSGTFTVTFGFMPGTAPPPLQPLLAA